MGFSLAGAFDCTAGPQVFFLLLMGHALADYPLQGGFLATFKNRNVKAFPPGFDRNRDRHLWIHCLTAHSLIHAAMVMLVTGLMWLALAELVLHWLIDSFRCEKHLTFTSDQLLHLTCKATYATLIGAGILQIPAFYAG